MQFKFKLTGLIASVLIVSSSFSQVANIKNVQPFLQKTSFTGDFTKLVVGFYQRFSDAENVSWYSVDKKYGVRFTVNDVMYRILFSRKGRLMYKIMYGTEKHLPVNIRKAVKSNYVEFLITSASLVEEDERRIWVINLEDDSSYVTVSFEDNEMIETVNLKKKR